MVRHRDMVETTNGDHEWARRADRGRLVPSALCGRPVVRGVLAVAGGGPKPHSLAVPGVRCGRQCPRCGTRLGRRAEPEGAMALGWMPSLRGRGSGVRAPAWVHGPKGERTRTRTHISACSRWWCYVWWSGTGSYVVTHGVTGCGEVVPNSVRRHWATPRLPCGTGGTG